MNSNITLRSNIYINKTGNGRDRDFLQHIIDFDVLKRYRVLEPECARQNGWMTPIQREILNQGQPQCALEKGTKSWGVPVGTQRFVCRCEERECAYYEKTCSKLLNFEQVCRTNEEQGKTAVQEEQLTARPITYEKLELKIEPAIDGKTVQSEEVKLDERPSVEESKRVEGGHDEKPEGDVDTLNAECDVQFTDQETIINADITKRIWVNAGPGTGKTYTVIQRIRKLLAVNSEKAILVICFSRNAVQVIMERLREVIGHQVDGYLADGHLIIRTFDSFASYMLDDELDTEWDYDQRIERFIEAIESNQEELNDMIDYMIVDEIQDIVGVRARMLLKLLDTLSCGVLLLGDCCQAIFDWTVQDKRDMTFDGLMKELVKRKFVRFELGENHRQSKKLSEQSLELRHALLNDDEKRQIEMLDKFKDNLTRYGLEALPKILSGAEELILCKTNGDTAYISQFLYDKGVSVPYIMKQRTQHRSLAAWIAMVLSDNDGNAMEKKQFMDNAQRFDVDNPEEKWMALKSLDKHEHSANLHVKQVLSALAIKDGLPSVCLNQAKNAVVVSTVHRAKGSEAKCVLWMDSQLVFKKENEPEDQQTISDALRASYVAVTRAKSKLVMLDRPKGLFLKSVQGDRWIQFAYSKKSGNPYCKGIALLPEDIDWASFADREYAQNSQSAISDITTGMPVDLYFNEDKKCFDVFFNGVKIGRMSCKFAKALSAGFQATNHTKHWPIAIRDVCVTDTITVLATGNEDVDEKYAKAGCWLGVELGGLPILTWSN